MMKQLLDSLTTTERITGSVILFVTVLLVKLITPFIRSLSHSFKPVLPPAVIVVHGPSSPRKSAIISALISRFEHSPRAFLAVSLDSLTSMLTPLQSRRYFASAFTAQGAAALEGLHRAWRAMVDAENNLIIDHNFVSDRVYKNFIQTVPMDNVVLVYVLSAAVTDAAEAGVLSGVSLSAFQGLTSGQVVTVATEIEAEKAAHTVAVRLGAMGLL